MKRFPRLTRTSWFSLLAVLAVSIALMTACPNEPENKEKPEPGTVDKTALALKITEADTAKEGVKTSTNGEDIPEAEKWVTTAVMNTLNTALTTAKNANTNTNATQAQVDNALKSLTTALGNFKPADGKKKGGGTTADKTALKAKIKDAKDLLEELEVIAATNGSDVYNTEYWISFEDKDTFDGAIGEAEEVDKNAAAAQSAVDAAVTALNKAMTDANAAKKLGSKPDSRVTVTFNLNGGTPPAGFNNPAKVDPGKAVDEERLAGITKALSLDPADRSTYLTVDESFKSPTVQQGLYRLGSPMSIEGWYKDGVKWDFSTTLAEGTPAFTLTANWSGGMDRQSGGASLQAVINRNNTGFGMEDNDGPINTDANRKNKVNFVYVMDGDEEINGSAENSYQNIAGRLMIVGKVPSEITNTAVNRHIFGLQGGDTVRNGGPYPEALLILGNNVTVRGKADSVRSVINLTGAISNEAPKGATFIMLKGSKITGNTNIYAGDNNTYRGGAINMGMNTTFIMEGGEIFGNAVTDTSHNATGGTRYIRAGGVMLFPGCKFIMRGGTIKGNKGSIPDVYVIANDAGGYGDNSTYTRFSMSGDATIGGLVLFGGADGPRRGYGVSIDKGWTGQVENLFLNGDPETTPAAWVGFGNATPPKRVIGGWDEPYSNPAGPDSPYVDAAPAAGIVARFLKLKQWSEEGLSSPILDNLSTIPDLTGYRIDAASGKLVAN